MGIQGMELFAIGVVIILFMAVLKQFGILEPMSSFEGKGPPEAPGLDIYDSNGKCRQAENARTLINWKVKCQREL